MKLVAGIIIGAVTAYLLRDYLKNAIYVTIMALQHLKDIFKGE